MPTSELALIENVLDHYARFIQRFDFGNGFKVKAQNIKHYLSSHPKAELTYYIFANGIVALADKKFVIEKFRIATLNTSINYSVITELIAYDYFARYIWEQMTQQLTIMQCKNIPKIQLRSECKGQIDKYADILYDIYRDDFANWKQLAERIMPAQEMTDFKFPLSVYQHNLI